MIEILINALSLAFVFLTFYFIIKGRGYEDLVERHAISYFMLGLLFVAFRIGSEIAVYTGFTSYLLNNYAAAALTILTPLCFIIGLKDIKEEDKEAQENTENFEMHKRLIKKTVRK